MSIVRIGLAETKKFAQGYDAIFGKRSSAAAESGRSAKAPENAAKKIKKKKK